MNAARNGGEDVGVSTGNFPVITNADHNQDVMDNKQKKLEERIKKKEEEKARQRELRAKELRDSMVTEEAYIENDRNTKKRSNELNNVVTTLRNEKNKKGNKIRNYQEIRIREKKVPKIKRKLSDREKQQQLPSIIMKLLQWQELT